MPVFEYGGLKIRLSDSGYLVNFYDWHETGACALAEREGIEELTKEKIDIIRFIRDYYKKYNFFPVLNAVCKNVHQRRKCVSEEFISPLLAWKLAGLPEPDELIVNLLEYGQSPG